MKKHIAYLLLMISSVINTSCKQEQLTPLEQFLKQQYHYTLNDSIENVLIIADRDCITCNRSYALLASQQLNNINFDNTLLVVNTNGASFDISELITVKHPNILFDPNATGKDTAFFHSQFYKLDHKQISRLIPINSDSLEGKLQYIYTQIMK